MGGKIRRSTFYNAVSYSSEQGNVNINVNLKSQRCNIIIFILEPLVRSGAITRQDYRPI